MICVEVTQQHAAGDHLIIKDQLRVVAGIDLAEFFVTRFQY